VFVYFNEDMQT